MYGWYDDVEEIPRSPTPVEWEDDRERDTFHQEAIGILEEEEMEGDKDIPPISDRYGDLDSDVDIISSDGIYFMVHSRTLKQVS